jgi:hypothetical protein
MEIRVESSRLYSPDRILLQWNNWSVAWEVEFTEDRLYDQHLRELKKESRKEASKNG